jgi:hypothetical protein
MCANVRSNRSFWLPRYRTVKDAFRDLQSSSTVEHLVTSTYPSAATVCGPVYDPNETFSRDAHVVNQNPETTLIAAGRYQPVLVPQGSMDGMNG